LARLKAPGIRGRDNRRELVCGLGNGCFLPRIVSGVDGRLHRRIERGANAFEILHDDRANSFDADPGDEIVSALAPFSVFAVELHEPAG
jgi:hypothetical protein